MSDWSQTVNDIYQQTFGRQADPSGMASFTAALNAGMTGEQMRAALASSPEGQSMGLSPAPAPVAPLTAAAAAAPTDGTYDPNLYDNTYYDNPDVIAAAAQAKQAVTPESVAATYQQLFNAPAPPDFVASVVNNYAGSSICNVARDMATSAAISGVPFANKPGDTNSFTTGAQYYESQGYVPGSTNYEGVPTSFIDPKTGQTVASYGTIAPVGGASTAVQSGNWTWNDPSQIPTGFTTDLAQAKTDTHSFQDFLKAGALVAAAVATGGALAPELFAGEGALAAGALGGAEAFPVVGGAAIPGVELGAIGAGDAGALATAGGDAIGAGSLTEGLTPEMIAAQEAALPQTMSDIGGLSGTLSTSGTGALATAGGAGTGAGSLTEGLTPEMVATQEAALPQTMSDIGGLSGTLTDAQATALMEQGLLPAELQVPAETAGLTAAEALQYAKLGLGAVGAISSLLGGSKSGTGAGTGKCAANVGGLGKTVSSGNVSKTNNPNATNNLANLQPALDTSPNLLRVGQTATDPLAQLQTQGIKEFGPAYGLQNYGCAQTVAKGGSIGGLAGFASGGSTKHLFCYKDAEPKFPEQNAELLIGRSSNSRVEPMVLKQIKSSISGLAQGGLPEKYQAAAPHGHKPEFITGITGYYACGGGTGQSDDIPAMLHDGDYVMDAETVSALGDGSSKAGMHVLEGFRSQIPHKSTPGGNPVPAKIADGEYVFPAAFVSALGRGDNKRGSEILDGLREKLRAHKRGAPLDKIPPKAKSPLDYIQKGKK